MTRIEIYDKKGRKTVKARNIVERAGRYWIRPSRGQWTLLDNLIEGNKSFHWNKHDNRMVIYR